MDNTPVLLRDNVNFSPNWELLDNGYLRTKATITQTGTFPYYKLGRVTASFDRPFNVNVPIETIVDKDFLKSLAGLPLTIEHPPEGEVTPDTYQKYSVGSIGDRVRVKTKGDDFALVDVTITVNDAEAVKLVRSGVRGLSLGYKAALVQDSNDPYAYTQRHRLGNHLSITTHPRIKSAQAHLDSENIPSQLIYECNLEIQDTTDKMVTEKKRGRIISHFC